MSVNNNYTKNTFRRLHIDRKMIGILVVFTILGIFLVVSMVIATNTLSGLRGYATFQVNWTEARKDASFELINYINTKDVHHLARFDSALLLIKNAQKLRHELLEEQPDESYIRELFLQTHTIEEDIENMTQTFIWFHSFAHFQLTIEEWVKSDTMISEMEDLAAEVTQLINENSLSAAQQQIYAERVAKLDRDLTASKHRLAESLSSGTRLLNFIILWVSIALGCILLMTGGLLSFRFLKSIKNWTNKIELSEQQYRSLYEQNPNAVFSLSPDGQFMDANNVVEKMIGYSLKELKEMKSSRFIKESELESVRKYFQKTLQGEPQTFETIGVLDNGKLLFAELTYLPIIVNSEITGVYGIARDITYRKKAEQKIKEQLEEKTHLISEVHDRVKNNLALVSSLIQLQQEMSGSNQTHSHLENTISRIHSMALVHERLYHNETFSSIRMDEYLNELVEMARKKYGQNLGEPTLLIDTQPVVLSIKQSIPVGLLLNELLINAFKHGTQNGTGKIEVLLYQEEDEVIIKISDEGPGLPEDISVESPKTLGMTLISSLIKQLNATHHLSKEKGTSFTIRFKTPGKISKTA